jgi:single-strand DNA-binding protein
MNLVILKGNITRPLEVTYTPRGTPVLDMGMAINKVWFDDSNQRQESVTYTDVRWYGRQAEAIAQHFDKGRPILLHGELVQDEWTDKETGKPRRKTLVKGQHWEFAGGDARGGRYAASQLPPAQQTLSGETVTLKRRPLPNDSDQTRRAQD